MKKILFSIENKGLKFAQIFTKANLNIYINNIAKFWILKMKNNLIIEAPSVIDLNRNRKFANCFIVDKSQPESIAKAVEQLGYYIKREGGFDFVQYVAYEDRDSAKVNAYIWVDTDWEDTFAVGAAGFRFLGDVGQINDWSLQWVWFHPYYRCKGL